MVVTVALPLGDITANQLRSLADIVRRFTRETIRTTVEQNFVIRWVSNSDLPEIYKALDAVGLGEPGAGTIVDIVTCPGTDTCKLGSPLRAAWRRNCATDWPRKASKFDAAVQNLHIKISGCFNSCGQHHVADLGFYGVSRKMAGYAVPHFQVVLGGEWEHNAGSYGLARGRVPSKNIPQVVTRLTDRYASDRKSGETFKDFVKRIGKVEIKSLLEDLTDCPPTADRSFFSDWGDPREYSLGDHGRGRMRGRSRSPPSISISPPPSARSSRRRVAFENGANRAGGNDGLPGDAARRQGAGENRTPGYPRRSRPDRRRIPRRAFTTRRNSSIRLRAENSRTICSMRTKSPDEPYTPDSTRYLIDEANFLSTPRTVATTAGHARQRLALRNIHRPMTSSARQCEASAEESQREADLEPLIPIFHGWIQDQVSEELLLDVADYRHVPAGPGVMLIGLEGGLQRGQHRRPPGRSLQPQSGAGGQQSGSIAAGGARGADGVVNVWKPIPGSAGNFALAARSSKYSSTTGCWLRTTRKRARRRTAEFQSFATKLFRRSDYSLAYNNEPRRLFGATLKASRSFSVRDLLKNLS